LRGYAHLKCQGQGSEVIEEDAPPDPAQGCAGELEPVDTTNFFPKMMRKDYSFGLNLQGAGDPDQTLPLLYGCFEWGSRVVKLCRSAGSKRLTFREAAIHAAVECLGLPVPTVWSVQQIDGRWGIVFDRLSGVSFAEQMQSDAAAIPHYLEILARLHTRIHAHTANQFSSLKD
jgi:hypothetical protein